MPRPSKTDATRETQQTLTEAGVMAAKFVRDILRGWSTVDGKQVKLPKRIGAAKMMAAKMAIEHAIGLPKAKIELKTDALTMKDIAEQAALWDPDSETFLVPTKPLTARQIRERAPEKVEQN